MQEIVRGGQARRDSLVLPTRRRKISIIAIIKERIINRSVTADMVEVKFQNRNQLYGFSWKVEHL